MALITLPPSFAHYSDNFGNYMAADGINGYGVGVAMGTSNADGTDTAVMSALTHDCEYLWIAIANTASTTEAPAALMDLLVDPAGGTSWSNLITDLLVGGAANLLFNSASGIPLAYHFPLWIPAGSSLGARIRRQSASARTARIMLLAAGGNKNPASWWCGQKVESVATFDAANSLGQLHTPGTGVSVSGAVDNGSGLIRLTVTSTAAMTTGDIRSVSAVTGTTEANGRWTITVVDGTHIDLQGSTFVNAYVSAGVVSGPFSSWTNLGSPTAARAGAAQWAVNSVNGTSQTSMTYDWEFGAGGARIGPRAYIGAGSAEVMIRMYQGPIFCDIAAGTQMQIRAAASGIVSGAGTNLDCAAYLVQ
jgi:hypothetical protein